MRLDAPDSCSAARRAAAARRGRTWTAPSTTNSAAKAPSTQGFCSALESSVPDSPAATPASGVGDRHPEDVDGRVSSSAWLPADLVALADDDPGQDRDHREHAGGEGQQQAEAEEAGDDSPEAAPRRICATRELSSAGASGEQPAAPAAAAGSGAAGDGAAAGGRVPGPLRHAACRHSHRRRRAPHRSACVRADSTGPASAQPWKLASTPMRCSPARLRSSATTACTGRWNTSVSPKFGSFLISPRGTVSDLHRRHPSRRPARRPILSRYR